MRMREVKRFVVKSGETASDNGKRQGAVRAPQKKKNPIAIHQINVTTFHQIGVVFRSTFHHRFASLSCSRSLLDLLICNTMPVQKCSTNLTIPKDESSDEAAGGFVHPVASVPHRFRDT